MVVVAVVALPIWVAAKKEKEGLAGPFFLIF